MRRGNSAAADDGVGAGPLDDTVPSKSKPVENKPMTTDSEIQQAITAPGQVSGDRGVDIAQQDRISFHPAAEGSIPLRVGAVDLSSDEKARSVGDIVTVDVVESISSEAKAATSLAKSSSISARLPNLLSGPKAEQTLSVARYQQPDQRLGGQRHHRHRRHVGR